MAYSGELYDMEFGNLYDVKEVIYSKDLPSSAQKTSIHAWDLRLRGAKEQLAKTRFFILPTQSVNVVSTPKWYFGAQYSAYITSANA